MATALKSLLGSLCLAGSVLLSACGGGGGLETVLDGGGRTPGGGTPGGGMPGGGTPGGGGDLMQVDYHLSPDLLPIKTPHCEDGTTGVLCGSGPNLHDPAYYSYARWEISARSGDGENLFTVYLDGGTIVPREGGVSGRHPSVFQDGDLAGGVPIPSTRDPSFGNASWDGHAHAVASLTGRTPFFVSVNGDANIQVFFGSSTLNANFSFPEPADFHSHGRIRIGSIHFDGVPLTSNAFKYEDASKQLGGAFYTGDVPGIEDDGDPHYGVAGWFATEQEISVLGIFGAVRQLEER